MSAFQKYQVLLAAHVSEKASVLSDSSAQHTFKVAKNATKLSVKNAVESIFSVKVKSVQVLNVKGKVKRRGRITGVRPGWKKAIVRLESGYDLDLLSGAGV